MSGLDIHIVANEFRRSRNFWRALAFVALFAVIAVVAMRSLDLPEEGDEDMIARIIINGPITTDPHRLAIIKQIEKEDQVKAVIVRINSPGGTTAGGEELYEALKALRQEKPVVTVINELGASAAYMAAIASDQIFARRLSLVGSIGVLVQHVDAGGLLETIGIDVDKVASGPLKAEPDIDEPLIGAPRASLQALVNDSFEWFLEIVGEERNLTRTDLLEVADGRIMTGRVAKESGLIDQFGGEREALDWLAETHEIDAETRIVTQFPLARSDWELFSEFLGASVGNGLKQGLGLALEDGVQAAVPGAHDLDGLVSLWHGN